MQVTLFRRREPVIECPALSLRLEPLNSLGRSVLRKKSRRKKDDLKNLNLRRKGRIRIRREGRKERVKSKINVGEGPFSLA